MLILILLGAADFTFASEAKKAATPEVEAPLPYLGPGADLLPPEEYKRIYTTYIKEAIQYGFPPDRCEADRCTIGLDYLFRTSGLYGYPMPAGADVKLWRAKDGTIECFESGGTIAQIARDGVGTLLEAFVVHSRSPRAAQALARACRNQRFTLETQPATGLERVAGVPVGYPHPFLCIGSQGLTVRRLEFSGDRTACSPKFFGDHAWERKLRLDEPGCRAVQADLRQAWQRQIQPGEFAKRERKRRAARIDAMVKERGGSKAEAAKILDRYYTGPIDHDLTVVGMAMRNLEVCNQVGLIPREGPRERTGPSGAGASGQGSAGQPGQKSAN